MHDHLCGGDLTGEAPDQRFSAARQNQRLAGAEGDAVAQDFRIAERLQGFERQVPDAYGTSPGQEDDVRRSPVAGKGGFQGRRQRFEAIRGDAEGRDLGMRSDHGRERQRVHVSDVSGARRRFGGDQLVAGGEDGHAGPPDDGNLGDAERRQQARFLCPEHRSRR